VESGTGRKGFENYVLGSGSIGAGGLDSRKVKKGQYWKNT